jgi:molybdopterin molybdotransferase
MPHHDLPLLSVEEALDRLTAGLSPVGTERAPLAQALGRVLAEPVEAPHPLPPFANSSMDGYAVRAADVAGASQDRPVELAVIGEAAAGSADLPEVGPGQAARITTGAPIPPGADAVVPVEATGLPEPMVGQAMPTRVEIHKPVGAGDFVRPAGLDVEAGRLVLPAGQVLRPQDIGMLAALGVSPPLVRRSLQIAVLSTGDEVIEIDQALTPGKIRDSNGYMLAALVDSAGAQAIRLGIAADSPGSIEQHLNRAVDAGADLVLTSAGVSMGAHDYVRQVIETQGQLDFWRVNIRPGKPMVYGSYRRLPFVGLPGNPVSAWVTFNIFVLPMLDKLRGAPRRQPVRLEAQLSEPVRSDGRESYLRARVWRGGDGHLARLTGSQDSGVLSSLIEANALVRLPAGTISLATGERVETWLIGSISSDATAGEG